MNSRNEMPHSPEKMPEASSHWERRWPVSYEGVQLDVDRPFPHDPEDDEGIAAIVGEPLPIIAGIRAGEGTFLVLDSRSSDRILTPYLLLQDDDHNGHKGIWPDEELTVGRDYLKDRFHYPPSVSRVHFSLFLDSETGALQLRDHESTNGTFITGFINDSSEATSESYSRNVSASFTRNIGDHLHGLHNVGEKDAEAPYGYFRNHAIIGRRSTSVRNGVYGTIGSEQVVVDDKSALVRQAVDSLMRRMEKFDAAPTTDARRILRIIEDQTATLLDYDLKETDRMSRPYYDANGLIDLSEYLKEGVGVCRHQALLAALFMEEAIARGYLKGTVAVERNYDKEINGAHAWAVYRDGIHDEFIVDAAQHFVGTRQEAMKQKRWRYLVPDRDE